MARQSQKFRNRARRRRRFCDVGYARLVLQKIAGSHLRATLLLSGLVLLFPHQASAQALREIRQYDIAPQRLDSALLQFSDQAGIQLVVDAELASGIDTRGVSAVTTGRNALQILLENTGLRFGSVGNTVMVFATEAEDEAPESPEAVAAANDPTGKPAGPPEPQSGGKRRRSYSFDEGEPALEEVVVTGTQIRGANARGSLPVTVFTMAEIEATGASSGDDLFRHITGAGAVTFGGNATRSITGGVNGARGDVSSINLRSLGTGNTLVLINGRRMISHPTVQTDPPGLVPVSSANMNSIPVSGLARVEILRDGASAIYGTDAVAGVVNAVLRGAYDGLEVTARHGEARYSTARDVTVNVYGGISTASGDTNVSLNSTYYQRNPVLASERSFSRSRDLRPLVSGTAFADDSQFDNRNSTTPWGHFALPNPVTVGGVTMTSFHLQPATMPGCLAAVPSAPGDACIDDGPIDDELHYDSNLAAGKRSMTNQVERFNHYLVVSHRLNEDLEWFTEANWFGARSRFNRAFGNTPIDSHPVWIPGGNYWNPFGAIALPDGSQNPNRLPGLDSNEVPAEGLWLPLQGGTEYRILDGGNRFVTVDDRSRRLVSGIRGKISESGWDVDSAIVVSDANSTDTTDNRISNTAFQSAAALATPEAYNFFNGAGVGNLIADGTPNPQPVLDRFYFSSIKQTQSKLFMADFKLSNPRLLENLHHGAAVALGVEYRREQYKDDRDPRLDGTITFTNLLGDTFGSDSMNSSPTEDSRGEREVWSAFAETAVPLVSDKDPLPLIRQLDLHLAARFESFSDVGDIVKPKAAINWRLSDEWQMRASYAEGFRAPNLAQINDGITRRIRSATDWYYCQAQVNKGVVADMNACDGTVGAGNNIDSQVERLSFGSHMLEPEEASTVSYGIVWTPSFIDGLTITADYWRTRQTNLIGLFGVPNQLAFDWALRINELGGNPLVVRDSPTPDEVEFFAGSGLDPVGRAVQTLDRYRNLDMRESSGADFELHYRLNDSPLGSFDLDIGVARMLSKRQEVSGPGEFINAQGEPAVQVRAGGDLLKRDGDPKLRARASLRWFRDNWDASLTLNYVGEVYDTSVTHDSTGQWWVVDRWRSLGLRAGHTFTDGAFEGTRLVLGIRNLTDEDPPLADASFGFLPELHEPYGRYWYFSASYQF